MNSVIEAHFEYLNNFPMMVHPYIRYINYKIYDHKGSSHLTKTNDRIDRENRLSNFAFETSILDQQRT